MQTERAKLELQHCNSKLTCTDLCNPRRASNLLLTHTHDHTNMLLTYIRKSPEHLAGKDASAAFKQKQIFPF